MYCKHVTSHITERRSDENDVCTRRTWVSSGEHDCRLKISVSRSSDHHIRYVVKVKNELVEETVELKDFRDELKRSENHVTDF
jgi:hypothetical protein